VALLCQSCSRDTRRVAVGENCGRGVWP
jgi:hypothetical protein